MAKAQVQILIQHQQNYRLLMQWLASDYDVSINKCVNDGSNTELIIVDREGLAKHRQCIEDAKQSAAPLFLPVLLITKPSKINARRSVADIVDDVLESPVKPILLKSRVDVLLRTRKLSEKAFEQSQSLKYLQRAIESASDSILLLDGQTVLYANPAAEKLFNLTLKTTQPEHYLGCIDADDEPLQAAIGNAQTGNWQGEMTLCNYDGHPFPVWVRIDHMHIENAMEFGLVITMSDMTRQRQMQDSEREQRLIAEVLQDTAIILTSTLDMQEVFERILENIERVIPQRATAIFLIENGYASVAQSQEFSKKALQQKKSFFDHTPIHVLPYFQAMIETKETMYLSNLSEIELPHLSTSKSIIVSPILLKEDIIGFILIEQKKVQKNSEQLSGRLTAFAAQVAIAIQNSRLYARAQSAAVFEERQRLARDFHDSVSQTLFSASFITETIKRSEQDISENSSILLDELYLLIRGALAEMRTLLLELKPTKLLETDLSDLLKQSAESLWSKKRINLDIDIEEEEELPLRVKVAFYRIAREALHNIVKHSQAEKVELYYRGTSDSAILTIVDDGIGFIKHDKKLKQGLGLSNMANRAKSINAEFSIEADKESGTIVHLLWNGYSE